ncbi:SWIM zinc finger family protein [Corynebacterium bovis]|uniref:SWIM zinc finger family protein n=2 Tax=Corynebacterium bovis TaxID=36808 RepID=UPI003139ECE3
MAGDGPTGHGDDTGRGRAAGRRRSGTPQPQWGDNVVVGDFSRRRRAPARTTGTGDGDGTPPRDGADRGQILRSGDGSWAGDQVIAAVAARADAGRMTRGRNYYRDGNVVSLGMDLNCVAAEVTGSQREPFSVDMRWQPLADRHRAFLEAEFSGDPSHLRLLLAGREPGPEVAALLLRPDQLVDSWCTCPDHGPMCKHRVAVAYALADHLTTDPTAVLTWRGFDTPAVLAAMRARAAVHGTTPPGGDDATAGRAGTAVGRGHGDGGTAGVAGTTGPDGTGDGTTGGPAGPEPVYSSGEFWGDLSVLPNWEHWGPEPGVDHGDTGALSEAMRGVSWNNVDALRSTHELGRCYEVMMEAGADGTPDPWAEPLTARPDDDDPTDAP